MLGIWRSSFGFNKIHWFYREISQKVKVRQLANLITGLLFFFNYISCQSKITANNQRMISELTRNHETRKETVEISWELSPALLQINLIHPQVQNTKIAVRTLLANRRGERTVITIWLLDCWSSAFEPVQAEHVQQTCIWILIVQRRTFFSINFLIKKPIRIKFPGLLIKLSVY